MSGIVEDERKRNSLAREEIDKVENGRKEEYSRRVGTRWKEIIRKGEQEGRRTSRKVG